MAEAVHAGKDHGEATHVRPLDHFHLAHRAAGLNNGCGIALRDRDQPGCEAKSASETMTEPLIFSPASSTLIAAMVDNYTRLIWSALTVTPFLVSMMAFHFTKLSSFHAFKDRPSRLSTFNIDAN
ncbi:MAG TPA: hypothetical protein PK970_13495 [Hyphomicrobiaceae bacterium]|nr:hypothetical protein [Hyphomicrobiaceae bacterium]